MCVHVHSLYGAVHDRYVFLPWHSLRSKPRPLAFLVPLHSLSSWRSRGGALLNWGRRPASAGSTALTGAGSTAPTGVEDNGGRIHSTMACIQVVRWGAKHRSRGCGGRLDRARTVPDAPTRKMKRNQRMEAHPLVHQCVGISEAWAGRLTRQPASQGI